MMLDGIEFRAACESDWPELRVLLAGARLPLEGAMENLGGFLLAIRDAALIGSACVERYSENGLLRSVAVAESEHGDATQAVVSAEATGDSCFFSTA